MNKLLIIFLITITTIIFIEAYTNIKYTDDMIVGMYLSESIGHNDDELEIKSDGRYTLKIYELNKEYNIVVPTGYNGKWHINDKGDLVIEGLKLFEDIKVILTLDKKNIKYIIVSGKTFYKEEDEK